jgi:hypothetical protein
MSDQGSSLILGGGQMPTGNERAFFLLYAGDDADQSQIQALDNLKAGDEIEVRGERCTVKSIGGSVRGGEVNGVKCKFARSNVIYQRKK